MDFPIVFSDPMARALLSGHKTQTRRLSNRIIVRGENGERSAVLPSQWRRIKPGDRLWVRERFATTGGGPIRYYATDAVNELRRCKPAIHMPRALSRMTLLIAGTRVERLQSITHEDSLAEGIVDLPCPNFRMNRGYGLPGWPADELKPSPRDAFMALWCSIHGASAWDENPEVVALTFSVVRENIDATQP